MVARLLGDDVGVEDLDDDRDPDLDAENGDSVGPDGLTNDTSGGGALLFLLRGDDEGEGERMLPPALESGFNSALFSRVGDPPIFFARTCL